MDQKTQKLSIPEGRKERLPEGWKMKNQRKGEIENRNRANQANLYLRWSNEAETDFEEEVKEEDEQGDGKGWSSSQEEEQ